MKQLKIKDEIDLKELEEFRFKPYVLAGKILYEFEERIGKTLLYNVKISKNRIIKHNVLSVHNEMPAIIFDLIKACFVEVVDE